MHAVIECSFLVPIRRDANVSDGELHIGAAWEWLDAVLFSSFGGRTIAPGLYQGIYTDPHTQAPVPDESRRYIVAVPETEVSQLRKLLAIACTIFQQKCIYLSIGGRVEFVEADDYGTTG